MLVIEKRWIRKHTLEAVIDGTQQNHLRGGTLNVVGIAGAFAACTKTMEHRKKKTVALYKRLENFMSWISSKATVLPYSKYKQGDEDSHVVVLLGPQLSQRRSRLPTTLMLAFINHDRPSLCNVKIKKQLHDRGIIVSVGSACNTSSKYASHVMSAIGAGKDIKRAVIRISISDETSTKDMDALKSALTSVFM